MGNPNYVKGRRKEYKIRKELLNNGYDIAQRSAGSHSPIDVFAINKKRNTILLIQAKPEGYNSKDYEKWKWLNNDFKVRFEIR
jgi:Holliday junction resolvase|tara:strand:+ start:692 stop:940 length:249 start_codon:yes stop_codon:yes gene_type:complete